MSDTTLLDPPTIYEYSTHRNIPWNIIEYQPLKDYQTPQQSKTKLQQYITKKGLFLDQHIKNVKDLPPPCKYQTRSQFDQTLNKKHSKKIKIDKSLKKNTYLEQIQRKAKLYKSPAVAQYKINSPSNSPTNPKKLKIGQKPRFYQDTQFLSTTIPGPGMHHPHDEVPHVKTERTTYKFWIDKHKQQNKRDRARSLKSAGPGTYRPVSASFNSFSRMELDQEKRRKREKQNKKPSHGFLSSDSKFVYTRKQTSKPEKRPTPCAYNTMIEWKGKGAQEKPRNWSRCLSAGPTRGVYH